MTHSKPKNKMNAKNVQKIADKEHIYFINLNLIKVKATSKEDARDKASYLIQTTKIKELIKDNNITKAEEVKESHWCDECKELYTKTKLKECPICSTKLRIVKEDAEGVVDTVRGSKE